MCGKTVRKTNGAKGGKNKEEAKNKKGEKTAVRSIDRQRRKRASVRMEGV